MLIRPARLDDASALWSIIGPTIRAAETYALDPMLSENDALAFRHPSQGYVDALVMFRSL